MNEKEGREEEEDEEEEKVTLMYLSSVFCLVEHPWTGSGSTLFTDVLNSTGGHTDPALMAPQQPGQQILCMSSQAGPNRSPVVGTKS